MNSTLTRLGQHGIPAALHFESQHLLQHLLQQACCGRTESLLKAQRKVQRSWGEGAGRRARGGGMGGGGQGGVLGGGVTLLGGLGVIWRLRRWEECTGAYLCSSALPRCHVRARRCWARLRLRANRRRTTSRLMRGAMALRTGTAA